ncbi:class I SAM-dependent methyltransferase [Azospirillum cavernae]|nr:class I SAM-dependent methyltransferase [Azospirillum cavernae]
MSTAGATPGNTPTANLAAEAAAFDQRIQERVAAGFVPDLRRMAPCDYFYKSFWRDPHFANLFVGWSVDRYLQLLSDRCGPGQRILDVGCGPGYVSLELARAGHHVTGIDISEANIDIARQTLAQNPWHEGFGSLDYQITPLHAVKGCWDVVLFSVSLHHMPDVAAAVAHAHTLVRPSGWLLTWEPCHDRFTERDAATVALVRTLLALTGHWYEPADIANLTDENSLAAHVRDVWSEYVFERDPSEPDGQSPNDLAADGAAILAALRGRFEETDFFPGYSYIYRLLGGIRGDAATVRRLADAITLFDRLSVKSWGQNPNHFFFMGRRRD